MTEVGDQVGETITTEMLKAVVEVMFLAADADGEISEVERDRLCSAIADAVTTSGPNQELTGTALDSFLAACQQRRESEGGDARLTALKAQLADTTSQEFALRCAIQVMAADGILRTSEREFLLRLAETLGVDGGRAADLVIAISRSN